MASPEDMLALGLDDANVVDAVDPVVASGLRENVTIADNFKRAKQDEVIRQRKVAFQRCFRDGNATIDDVKIVMEVMDRFCRWRTSTYHTDARMHALAEGRREVRLMIHDYCELSVDQLFTKLA